MPMARNNLPHTAGRKLCISARGARWYHQRVQMQTSLQTYISSRSCEEEASHTCGRCVKTAELPQLCSQR